MFLTPYSTAIGSKFKLDTIYSGIRRAEINEELANNAYERVKGNIKLVAPRSREFQPFSQPILKADFSEMYADVVIDGRSFIRSKEDTALKNDIYAGKVRYGKLSHLWSIDEKYRNIMMTSTDYHIKAFGGWLSGEIGRRLALDPLTLASLRLMLIVHFIQMGDDRLKNNGSKDNQLAIVTMASRKIPGSAPITAYQNILKENVPYLSGLEDTIEWIKQTLDTPTISQLNSGLIYALVGGSTFPTLRDTLAISIEYPPAFMTIVYDLLVERGANRTALGRFLLNSKDRNSESHFIRTVDRLLEEEVYV